ncbi:MAG TPA: hypothetical protein VHA33_17660, partial [Candidatus Angelobacter sp.]|nr:hypothetical protein [Candidatus Angelobacter sp.]
AQIASAATSIARTNCGAAFRLPRRDSSRCLALRGQSKSVETSNDRSLSGSSLAAETPRTGRRLKSWRQPKKAAPQAIVNEWVIPGFLESLRPPEVKELS